MRWTEKMRRLTKLSPWTALLVAAVGCGGGDKSPTGPQGGDNVADSHWWRWAGPGCRPT